MSFSDNTNGYGALEKNEQRSGNASEVCFKKSTYVVETTVELCIVSPEACSSHSRRCRWLYRRWDPLGVRDFEKFEWRPTYNGLDMFGEIKKNKGSMVGLMNAMLQTEPWVAANAATRHPTGRGSENDGSVSNQAVKVSGRCSSFNFLFFACQ